MPCAAAHNAGLQYSVHSDNPARHNGMEHMLGSLETGKEADLTILEKDPLVTDMSAISAIKVSETWVAGQKVFG